MILSDVEIVEAIKRKEIIVEPFVEENVGPCSIDLTLSDEFAVFKEGKVIDPQKPETLRESIEIVKTNDKPFMLKPKQFVLAMTREKIGVSKNIAATLEGRSSIARLGIVVHAAGLVSPGSGMLYPKPLILEVFSQNVSSVKLYPGMRIVQVIFHRLSQPAATGYDEHPRSTYKVKNVWIKSSALL